MRGTAHPPPTINRKNVALSAILFKTGAHDKREEKRLTAFEIARSVDALPCVRVVAVHTACQPAVSLLGARATAEPATSVAARLLRGTCAVWYALAVADLQGLRASALGGVVRREGRESVNALECASP